MKMCLQAWEIEQLRDAVQRMDGELNIRIFTPDGEIFRIWFNPADQIALYGRVVWNEKEQRERMMKVYLRQIQRAVNEPKAKVRVEYRDGEKLLEWFDREDSEEAAENAYRFVMDLLKRRRQDHASNPAAASEDKDR